MIQFNFEFDSKGSVSSELYHWFSSFPLDISRLKLTTSFDYVDDNSNQTHHLGSIVMKAAAKNDFQPLSSSNVHKNTENQKLFSNHQNAAVFSGDLNNLPKNKTFGFSFKRNQSTESANTAFDSDLEDSLLFEVAFNKEETTEVKKMNHEFINQNLHQSKQLSDSIDDKQQNVSSVNIEETNFEDFDFLLDSLDEFNT